MARCEGDPRGWAAEAAEQGDATLTCPGCDGILYLCPVRTEGGTVQWARTAFGACTVPVRVGVVGALVVLVLLMLSAAASATHAPAPAPSLRVGQTIVQSAERCERDVDALGTELGQHCAAAAWNVVDILPAGPVPAQIVNTAPVPVAVPTPVPVRDVSGTTGPASRVVIGGVDGPASTLLACVAGLALATSAASLVSGWHR